MPAPDRRTHFLKRLQSVSCVPLDVLTFVFPDLYACGPTCGANRNNLLADSTGEMVVTIDDDVICTSGVPSTHTSSQATLVLSSE